MSALELVADFQNQRTTFLSWFAEQSRLIRHQPKSDTVAEVKANLREHGCEHLNRLVRAAIVMASEASDHICVTAKPPGFYDVEVPKMCKALQLRLPQLAARLGINPKCDMCVHFIIENILLEPGF
ncbi:hypothetical protein N7517_001018 [Penicillium concentricum]|uniref:Uncharacterized protein n=1 Tax=Penicillium concentricum TaxID=293559 RepID=A0A9W9SR39_9EURO|nr:uncharacterized protein N7517_001018 [Penicillium concentricum]KAJ5383107.1 hypothetical protein N7517_001018 [Penicillium concentricum]